MGLPYVYVTVQISRCSLILMTIDTFKGAEHAAEFLQKHKNGCRVQQLVLDKSLKGREPTVAPLDYTGNSKSVNAYLDVETDVGRGRGIVRLCKDPADGNWKAYTLYTVLQELKGFEEPLGPRRSNGVEHGGQPGRLNWLERRNVEKNYSDGSSPTVVVVGAHPNSVSPIWPIRS